MGIVFNYIHVKGSFFQNDIYLYTGSPHIVLFHFVRFTLCATFGNSTLLSIKPHFVLKKIAQSEIYTNVHFVRNFTLCEFS